MLRARKSGVLTPCIFHVENDAATIFMERIVGQSVRDVLLSGNLAPAGMPASAIFHDLAQPLQVQLHSHHACNAQAPSRQPCKSWHLVISLHCLHVCRHQ